MDDADFMAFERIGPSRAETPLVCAVPHAGRAYPAALMRDSAVPRSVLEGLEDRHADLLVHDLVADGAVAIVARVARAWIDLNRAPEEIDPAMSLDAAGSWPSARVRGGLGLIPRRLGARELIARLPGMAEVRERLAHAHLPYHRAIATALADAVGRHGFAVLLDCHSMPPLRGVRAPRLVIGDRHGRSAERHVTDGAVRAAGASGHGVALNAPYAGAYTLDRHGKPLEGVHALQLEIDRTLYLEPGCRVPRADLGGLRGLTARIGWAAVRAARGPLAIAAE